MSSFETLQLPTTIFVIIECTLDDCDARRERSLYAVTSEAAAQQAVVYEDTRNKQLAIHETALSVIWNSFFDPSTVAPVTACRDRKPRVLDFDTSGNYDEYEKALENWKKEMHNVEAEYRTEQIARSKKATAALMEYANAHNLDGRDLEKLGAIDGHFYGMAYNLDRSFRYEELELKAV